MKLMIVPCGLSVALGLGLCTSQPQLSSQSLSQPSPSASVMYQQHNLPNAVAHVVKIPRQGHYSIRPVVAEGLIAVDKFARQQPQITGRQPVSTTPIAVINGGYFDPINQQTTSYIRINGQVQADPYQNARLVENPDLQVYLPKILNRSEFRQYQCGTQVQYVITTYQHPIPPECRLNYSLGAGPQLLPQLTLQAEGFTDSVNGQITRDAIGSRQPNARSAIGITKDGDILWVMVEQQSTAKPGLSLPALADFLKQQGAEVALNLDGGSSSVLAYKGRIYPGKPNPSGQSRIRPVKSVLILQKTVSD